MSSTQTANPLIKNDQPTTIDAIKQYVDWLCIQKANDSEAHPGESLQLEVLRQALATIVCV